jgi:hypothetical protein
MALSITFMRLWVALWLAIRRLRFAPHPALEIMVEVDSRSSGEPQPAHTARLSRQATMERSIVVPCPATVTITVQVACTNTGIRPLDRTASETPTPDRPGVVPRLDGRSYRPTLSQVDLGRRRDGLYEAAAETKPGLSCHHIYPFGGSQGAARHTGALFRTVSRGLLAESQTARTDRTSAGAALCSRR